MKNIMFKKGTTTTSYGRNGTLTTTGLEISYLTFNTPCTHLRPITSKGFAASSCIIEIPAEECPFQALDALMNQTKILPTLMGIHPLLDKLIADKLKEA